MKLIQQQEKLQAEVAILVLLANQQEHGQAESSRLISPTEEIAAARIMAPNQQLRAPRKIVPFSRGNPWNDQEGLSAVSARIW